MESFQLMTGSLSYQATSPIGHAVPSLSIVLILRAFTSGSASLTGVEAISNAVPFFKSPKKECRSNLDHYVTDFRFPFAGITFLNYWMGLCLNTAKLFFHRWLKASLAIPS